MAKIKYHSAEAVKELRTLVQEFKNLNTTVNSAGTAGQVSLSKIESKLLSIQMLSGKTVSALNKLTASVDKGTAAQTKNSKAIEYQLKLANVYNKKISEGTKLNKANTKSLKSKTSAFKALRNQFGLFLGLNFFKQVAVGVFNQAKDFDSLNFSMKTVSDTAFDLAASQRFLLSITEDYGVELLSTSQRYVKFLAAAKQSNISLNDTEKIFRSVTKAASVLGLKTEELNGVYLALEQMLSKGKVTTEELRRQLGERLPGAMGIMAAALDVTIPKLDEMLRKGEVMSAETLPKFAEALEAAYGIESVKKVDTLVAAQNRLVNIWQTFIQDVSSGDGVLSEFFKNAINGATNFVKLFGEAFGSNKLKTQLMTIEFEKETEAKLDQDARKIIENSGIKIINYSQKIQNKRNEILLAGQSKRKDLLNKSVQEREKILRQEESDLIKANIKQNRLIDENGKIVARKKLSFAIKEYNYFKKQNENLIKETKEAEEELSKLKSKANNEDYESDKALLGDVKAYNLAREAYQKLHSEYGKNLEKTIKENKEYLKRSNTDLALATAEFNVFRKKLQVSDPQVIPVKPLSNNNKKQLNEIKDLQNKIDVERLQSSIQLNKLLLNSDETLIEEKKQLLLDISKYEIEIARITANDKNYVDRIKYEKEKKALEKYLKEKKITQKEYDNQIIGLNKQRDQKLELNELEYNKKMKASKLGLGKDLLKIVEEQEKIETNIIKDKYNKQIIALNNTYNSSKKTAKDWEELERGKKKVAIDMANEIIDAQIAILEAQKAIPNQSEESIDKIIRLINKLEASKKSLSPNEKDVISWQEWAQKIGEVINEVGSFVDALYARKIEAIDAEIAAEEAKYDRLIALAENDAAEKEALEKQKADKIAILEKQRLKEEQKAAKARKAFAIADIIINTAVAVSKVLYNPFLVALASSLGAVQLATVLATPIPQYKDGLDNAKSDHTAIINDGGKKEYVERNGKILSTNTKNAIVSLKKNDTVHKDYESMQKNSNIYSIIANGEILKQNEFDKLANIMEGSIIKGFSKAKVNANFKNVNKTSNSYLKEKSRFNG
jgi:tape measure domain-containing protein